MSHTVEICDGVIAHPRGGFVTVDDGDGFRLPGTLMQILVCLAGATASNPKTKGDIAQAMYSGAREADVPLDLKNNIGVNLSRLRAATRPYGIIVCRSYGYGWWLERVK